MDRLMPEFPPGRPKIIIIYDADGAVDILGPPPRNTLVIQRSIMKVPSEELMRAAMDAGLLAILTALEPPITRASAVEYGRSPAMDALPYIREMNATDETDRIAASAAHVRDRQEKSDG